MAELLLRDGAVALVDEADLGRLVRFSWRRDRCGHVRRDEWRNGKPVTVMLHREVFGALPGQTLDHINRNPLDNRRANLRLCDAAGNVANRDPQKSNKRHSRYKGVTFHRKSAKWQAVCGHTYLGLFASEEDAARAYDAAALKAFGEFARTNFGPSGWTQEMRAS